MKLQRVATPLLFLALQLGSAHAAETAALPAPDTVHAPAVPPPSSYGPRGAMQAAPGRAYGRGPGALSHAFSLMPPEFLAGLDLSDDEKDKIFAILNGRALELRGALKQARASHEDLRDMVRSGGYDEARAHALTDAGARAEAQARFLVAKTDSEILALLTPEQRQDLEHRYDAWPHRR
jgi:Spy/CpxP family protein refolding chaperone